MLSENMFIDTKADADKLKSDAFLNKIAKGHANGLIKAFGLKKKKTSKPKPSNPSAPSKGKETFYRVVAGSYKERKNADAQLAKLKKAGIDAFLDVFEK